MLVGNDISLNGFRQIIYSGKFAEDAFLCKNPIILEITKNLFEF